MILFNHPPEADQTVMIKKDYAKAKRLHLFKIVQLIHFQIIAKILNR
jgi:hypothetical protein